MTDKLIVRNLKDYIKNENKKEYIYILEDVNPRIQTCGNYIKIDFDDKNVKLEKTQPID